MNNQIEVGCLAIAVLPTLCCGTPTAGMRIPFTVTDIETFKAQCVYCKRLY